MVFPKHLCGPLGRFRTGNLTESLDCGSCDPQRHRAKAGNDAGKRRETIARLGQNVRVGEPRPIAARHKHIAYDHIVAAGAAQPTDSPRVNDLAIPRRDQHESGFRRSG
jgi:hypothetical protein